MAVYAATAHWPKSETYGLVSQVRRAAVSAETNIAEGSGKRGRKEFRRFLDIALGSLAEVECLVRIARDLKYLDTEDAQRLDRARADAGRLTWRLYQSIDRQVTP
jgi:four helix bundle protein